MIVDPWGEILAQASNAKEEIIYASLDPKKPQRLRRMFPGFKPAFIN
jgi:predicted amidohydrolase